MHPTIDSTYPKVSSSTDATTADVAAAAAAADIVPSDNSGSCHGPSERTPSDRNKSEIVVDPIDSSFLKVASSSSSASALSAKDTTGTDHPTMTSSLSNAPSPSPTQSRFSATQLTPPTSRFPLLLWHPTAWHMTMMLLVLLWMLPRQLLRQSRIMSASVFL